MTELEIVDNVVLLPIREMQPEYIRGWNAAHRVSHKVTVAERTAQAAKPGGGLFMAGWRAYFRTHPY